MTSTMVGHVVATDSALALLASLRQTHGPLILVQSDACNDEVSMLCYALCDFAAGTSDVYLGNLDGTPFYIGYDQFEFWLRSQLVIDAVDGIVAANSIDSALGKRFVVRPRTLPDGENVVPAPKPPDCAPE